MLQTYAFSIIYFFYYIIIYIQIRVDDFDPFKINETKIYCTACAFISFDVCMWKTHVCIIDSRGICQFALSKKNKTNVFRLFISKWNNWWIYFVINYSQGLSNHLFVVKFNCLHFYIFNLIIYINFEIIPTHRSQALIESIFTVIKISSLILKQILAELSVLQPTDSDRQPFFRTLPISRSL